MPVPRCEALLLAGRPPGPRSVGPPPAAGSSAGAAADAAAASASTWCSCRAGGGAGSSAAAGGGSSAGCSCGGGGGDADAASATASARGLRLTHRRSVYSEVQTGLAGGRCVGWCHAAAQAGCCSGEAGGRDGVWGAGAAGGNSCVHDAQQCWSACRRAAAVVVGQSWREAGLEAAWRPPAERGRVRHGQRRGCGGGACCDAGAASAPAGAAAGGAGPQACGTAGPEAGVRQHAWPRGRP